MASLVLSGDTSGSITVSAPAVAGSTTQTLVNVTGTLAPVVSGSAITLTNQTAPDFTSIPSWVKRITVMFSGVSTNGANYVIVQLGTSGGYETSGYLGTASSITASTVGTENISTGFWLRSASAANVRHGQIFISLINPSTNTWVANGVVGLSDTTTTMLSAGSKALSGTLDRIRIISSATGSPSDQFDAGTINIIYE